MPTDVYVVLGVMRDDQERVLEYWVEAVTEREYTAERIADSLNACHRDDSEDESFRYIVCGPYDLQ